MTAIMAHIAVGPPGADHPKPDERRHAMGTRGEERLKAITDAATEVVAERGYYGMTIQEVSDRVGITQAGLLKYVN